MIKRKSGLYIGLIGLIITLLFAIASPVSACTPPPTSRKPSYFERVQYHNEYLQQTIVVGIVIDRPVESRDATIEVETYLNGSGTDTMSLINIPSGNMCNLIPKVEVGGRFMFRGIVDSTQADNTVTLMRVTDVYRVDEYDIAMITAYIDNPPQLTLEDIPFGIFPRHYYFYFLLVVIFSVGAGIIIREFNRHRTPQKSKAKRGIPDESG